MKIKNEQAIQALKSLRSLVKKGMTIYTVGRGGIVAVLIVKKGKILNISGDVSGAIGYKYDKHVDAIRIGVHGWVGSEFGVIVKITRALSLPDYSLVHKQL